MNSQKRLKVLILIEKKNQKNKSFSYIAIGSIFRNLSNIYKIKQECVKFNAVFSAKVFLLHFYNES